MTTTDWFNAAFGIVFGAGWALACLAGVVTVAIIAGMVLRVVADVLRTRWQRRRRRRRR